MLFKLCKLITHDPVIARFISVCMAAFTSRLAILDFSFMHRFDRDWKKIEDFVGSKTVIQVLIIWFGYSIF